MEKKFPGNSLPICGHIGCYRPFNECKGHICMRFYRSHMSFEELGEFLVDWAFRNHNEVLQSFADKGCDWAKLQIAERESNALLDTKT